MLPGDPGPLRYLSCVKIRYHTRKEARRDARRRVVPAGGRMRAYNCPYCPYWHVGHLPYLVRTGQLTARQYYYLAKRREVPVPGQRPIDMTEGLMTPLEVADAFRVTVQTVYQWARAYQANNLDSNHAQLDAMLTPGGEWRFSTKAVQAILEDGRHGE